MTMTETNTYTMTTAPKPLGLSTNPLEEAHDYAEVFCESGFFKDARSVAQAKVKILAGQKWHLDPFEAMTGFNIIQGKLEVSAHMIAQRVKGDPLFDYRIERLDEEVCVIQFYQKGEPLGPPFSYSMEDARRAGKGSSQQYKQHPRNMLFARCISNGVKMYCPSVLAGVGPVYAEGELPRDERNVSPQKESSMGTLTINVDQLEPEAKPEAKPDPVETTSYQTESQKTYPPAEVIMKQHAEAGGDPAEFAKIAVKDPAGKILPLQIEIINERAAQLGYDAAKMNAGAKRFSKGRCSKVEDMLLAEADELIDALNERVKEAGA